MAAYKSISDTKAIRDGESPAVLFKGALADLDGEVPPRMRGRTAFGSSIGSPPGLTPLYSL
ncbi:MAG: hypothetical protein AVDCRST_MAG28-385 [uncultured Rubrobacteraceae bacterium]|uniref:Uncharacterized protein n=1 Tax=uncultured Rubrobacteraceae bacterium TaxID=349277 RepID=A0A6J4QAU2_9ACTN|nr:MAG: hypothetical protein AVDCRST_MAG28-385 [uncultured Rubrobacteraceae bacterium]